MKTKLAILITITLMALSVVLSSISEASTPCYDELAKIYSKKRQSVARKTAQMKKFSQSAISKYKKITSEYEPSTNKVYVEDVTMMLDEETGKNKGIIIGVTDGGDESYIGFYMNLKGETIYAKWHNQSPMYFWYCESLK